MKCQGKTNKGKPCSKTVKNNYCCHHQNQCIVCYKNVKMEDKADNLCQHTMHIKCLKDTCLFCKQVIIIPPTKKSRPKGRLTHDCSICLEEVNDVTDCQLICGHGHHIACINQLVKKECPVCRGPLTFLIPTNINMKKIDQRDALYKEKLKKDQDVETRILVNQLSSRSDLDSILEKSLIEYELEDNALLFKILEESLNVQ